MEIKHRLTGATLLNNFIVRPGVVLQFTNLSYADLKGADLRGVSLVRIDLTEADLREADLRGVDFRDVRLARAQLAGANLEGADLRTTELTGADLTGANLNGANLSGVDLTGVRIDAASLRHAYLRGVVHGAGQGIHPPMLSEADLSNADLRGARFRPHAGFAVFVLFCAVFAIWVLFQPNKRLHEWLILLNGLLIPATHLPRYFARMPSARYTGAIYDHPAAAAAQVVATGKSPSYKRGEYKKGWSTSVLQPFSVPPTQQASRGARGCNPNGLWYVIIHRG